MAVPKLAPILLTLGRPRGSSIKACLGGNQAHCGVHLPSDLFIERFCMTGGNSPICYLKAYHTNLYLSSDAEKVSGAIEEGESGVQLGEGNSGGSLEPTGGCCQCPCPYVDVQLGSALSHIPSLMLPRASSFHRNKAFLELHSSSKAKALFFTISSCMQREVCHLGICFCCERPWGQAAGTTGCVHLLAVFASSPSCFALLLNR